jgi:hypothetical protein
MSSILQKATAVGYVPILGMIAILVETGSLIYLMKQTYDCKATQQKQNNLIEYPRIFRRILLKKNIA